MLLRVTVAKRLSVAASALRELIGVGLGQCLEQLIYNQEVKVTALEIAKEYFPYETDEILDFIIWEKTGYPSFWNIPGDGATPEECFRKQLRRAALDTDGV